MKKRMTVKAALKLTMELWCWIAKTGATSKKNWPGWKKARARYGDIIFDCPLCECAEQVRVAGEDRCYKCPLKATWGKPKIGDTSVPCCGTNWNAHYGLWRGARPGLNVTRPNGERRPPYLKGPESFKMRWHALELARAAEKALEAL